MQHRCEVLLLSQATPPTLAAPPLWPSSAAGGTMRAAATYPDTHVGSPHRAAEPTSRRRRGAKLAALRAQARATAAGQEGGFGEGEGWVTCRTGAGAWGSRISRFRQQREERRKMPQTPLERWSGTERQIWQPREGSGVSPVPHCRDTVRWTPACSPRVPTTGISPKTLLLVPVLAQSWRLSALSMWGCFFRVLCPWFGAPRCCPIPLPVNHPWGARLPQ